MHLLDDVCLIESEVLARPPTAGTLDRVLNHKAKRLQVMNSAILEKGSIIVRGSMIGSHCWKKTVEI